jgi:hypothetical protein
MFDILKSVWNYALGWVFRATTIAFVALSAVYSIVAWIANEVLSRLDISPLTGLQTVVDAIPSAVKWWALFFRLDVGLPLILGAMLTKFIIRRIPLIG